MLEKTGLELLIRRITQHRRQILAGCGLLLIFSAGLALTELFSQYYEHAALVEARLKNHSLNLPPGIYAAPRRVSLGQPLTEAELKERLLRAGYQEAGQAEQFSAGSFTAQAGVIEIRTSEFAQNEALPAAVRVDFSAAQDRKARQRITGIHGATPLTYILLPAEMITANIQSKKQTRRATAYGELPPVLIKALTAIEDRRFFEHSGLDLRSMVRAAWQNLRAGEVREGASTITQQFVKNHFLTKERTWERKGSEMLMALALERQLSKEQILELYSERVFLGRSGITEIYGFKQAAQVWFGKELSEIKLSEAALLAGVIKAPNRYAPRAQPGAARARRNVVLAAMVEAGHLSAGEAEAAQSEQLALCPPPPPDTTAAPHFVDYLRRALAQHQAEETPHLRIQTTLDLDLQQAAVEAIREQTARLDKLVAKREGVKPEAALIALNPQTGEILALVGGRDYTASQLNRATDARRQPGSVFKPFVYAAALNRGISPMTTFLDAPQEFHFGYRAVYRPRNYGRTYSNQPVMLREGIIRSLNIVTVEAAQQTGLYAVAELAERAGLPRPENYPSMALGAFEATPLEIARAYTVFANQGVRVEPAVIKAITVNGVTDEITAPTSSVLSPGLAYVVTETLREVVNRGTAAQLRRAGFKGAVAGKTGSSRDAWFAGYTPNLLVVVWVGFDDHRDLRMTGGQAAVPIWASFMARVLALRPELASGKFVEPGGLESFEVDPQTGLMANEYCPRRQQLRLPGYMTPAECFEHQALLEQGEDGSELTAEPQSEALPDLLLLPPVIQQQLEPTAPPIGKLPTAYSVTVPELVRRPVTEKGDKQPPR